MKEVFKFRKKNKALCVNKEIFEVHPIILGGSPTDENNKIILTREQHIEAVNYWNKIIKDLKK